MTLHAYFKAFLFHFGNLKYVIVVITEATGSLTCAKLEERNKSVRVKTIGTSAALLKQVECNLMQRQTFPLLLDPAFIENPKCYFRDKRRSARELESLSSSLPLCLSQLLLLSTV